MDKRTKVDLYHVVIETFGIENQLRKLMEECGEVVAETNHYIDSDGENVSELVKELVDVRIMSEQILMYLFESDKSGGLERLACEAESYKLWRLKERCRS